MEIINYCPTMSMDVLIGEDLKESDDHCHILVAANVFEQFNEGPGDGIFLLVKVGAPFFPWKVARNDENQG